MARERRSKKSPKKAASLLLQLREDIRSLNSSILIISQKMKYLVRNEKILGRNLIVLNNQVIYEESTISIVLVGINEVILPIFYR